MKRPLSSVPGNHAPRYVCLDAWRGAASLAVVLYHGDMLADRSQSWLLLPGVVRHFWLAVQLFFVISGYCLAAAVDRALSEEMPARSFVARRVRRIAPPYLGSVVFTIAASALGMSIGLGLRHAISGISSAPASFWVQNFTLTQWATLFEGFWAGHPARTPTDNPVLINYPYWSLCYEEQFYLVLAAALAFRRVVRPTVALVVLSGATALVSAARPDVVTGLFVDYWLQFACGALLFVRLCRTPSARRAGAIDLGLASVLAATAARAWLSGDWTLDEHRYQHWNQLGFTAAFALLLVALRPTDGRLAQNAVVRALRWLGAMSYSLYLIHWPMRDAVWALHRLAGSELGGEGVSLALTLLVAYGFHRLLERPFMNPSRREQVVTL